MEWEKCQTLSQEEKTLNYTNWLLCGFGQISQLF